MTAKICRICEGNKVLLNLFERDNELTLKKLRECADILVEIDDGLPPYICEICNNNLEFVYGFKKQCKYTDNILRARLKNKDLMKCLNEENVNNSKRSPSNDYIMIEPIEIKREYLCENEDYSLEGIEKMTQNNTETNELSKDIEIKEKSSIKTNENHVQSDLFDNGQSSKKTKTKRYMCLICERNYYNSTSLRKHSRIHTGEKPYTCDVCNKSFRQLATLKTHKFTHTGERPFKCKNCDKGFTTQTSRKTHIRRHPACQQDISPIPKELPSQRKSIIHEKLKNTENKDLMKCLNEKNVNNSKSSPPNDCIMLEPIEIKEEYPCENEDFTLEGIQKITIISNIEPNERTNDIETKQKCSTKTNENHVQSDLFDNKNKTNTRRRYFKKINVNRYTCLICEKNYYNSTSLRKHSKIHTGEKPYTCDVCNKSFGQLATLQTHKFTHTGERPFKCKNCDSAFTTQSSRKRHIRRHPSCQLDISPMPKEFGAHRTTKRNELSKSQKNEK